MDLSTGVVDSPAPPLTKGERSLQHVTAPRVDAELPGQLRGERVFAFSAEAYDVRGAAAELLAALPAVGSFAEDTERPRRLEEFRVTADVFRSFKARQLVYQAVASNAPLLHVYERLVMGVVLPALKAELSSCAAVAETGHGDSFHVQWPPTLRLQPGPSEQHGRTHRDAEYGHQVGEVNFWMPLTSYASTRTTLHVVPSPAAGEFHPLEVDYGQIAAFHGALCQHYAPPNASACLRASLDFRVGIGAYFDPEWTLPFVKALHSWRRVPMAEVA